eukprot:TRINITY_DN83618_c0_g1_i1.p1 TRINITY_DN83618_c0_g1~~TRINITY_DN83618_c0_g1_i1.p1  ORF type:complete len:105 (-),score=15.67 TRINITY_DN83618_c0_g1_i1:273-587(-)
MLPLPLCLLIHSRHRIQTATAIITQWRSVQEMGVSGRTSRFVFLCILAAAMPHRNLPSPNANLSADSLMHHSIFVHCVDGIEAGICISLKAFALQCISDCFGSL